MTAQICEYKGRKYRLAWEGQTKFGRRAKLQFIDGSKEFWVAADSITTVAADSITTVSADRPSYAGRGSVFGGRKYGRRTCSYCGASDCPRATNPRDLCQED